MDIDELAKEFAPSVKPSEAKALESRANIDELVNEFAPKDEPKIEEKKQEFWQGLNDDPSWSGLAKRIGIGALRGAKDVVDTGAHGVGNVVSAIADKTLPESLAGPIRKSVEGMKAEDKAAQEQYSKEYPQAEGMIPNAGDVGRIGGQVAATIPVMPARLIQGVNAAVGALPTISATGTKIAAPIINRLTGAAASGAIGGATLGATTASTNDESLPENVGKGALSGLIAGPLLTGSANAAKTVGGKVLGKISHTTADLAKRAEELGIDLKATQVSGSPLLKKLDQVSGMLPFSGAQGITDKQVGQFTRAISRTFGEDSSEITPKMIADARKRIGGDMENIYKGSTVKVDKHLADDLRNVVDNAKGTVAENELKPIVTQIKNIVSKIDQNGEISGEAYHGLTKYDAMLSKAQKSSNPNIASHANQIRSALEDILDRNLPSDQKAALSKARGQYKAAMTVKDLVDQSAEGYVSPLKLMQKVNKSPGGKLRSGELGEIADIGRKFFPTPADSGTPLGETIMHSLGAVLHNPLPTMGAAAGALASGGAAADIASGGVGLAVNRLIRAGVNSKVARNAIIRSGTGETHGLTNKLAGAVTPYSAELDRKREPLRITIYK